MCDPTQRHDLCMWYQSSIILRIYRCLSLRRIITKARSLSFQTPTLSLGRATSLHETNRHRLLTRLMMLCANSTTIHAIKTPTLSLIYMHTQQIQLYEFSSTIAHNASNNHLITSHITFSTQA